MGVERACWIGETTVGGGEGEGDNEGEGDGAGEEEEAAEAFACSSFFFCSSICTKEAKAGQLPIKYS